MTSKTLWKGLQRKKKVGLDSIIMYTSCESKCNSLVIESIIEYNNFLDWNIRNEKGYSHKMLNKLQN